MRQSCSSAYCGEGAFIWTTQSIKIIPVSPFLFKHPIGWNNGRSRCNKIFESCVNFFNSARHWSGWNFRPHGRMASRIQIQNGHLLEASNYFRIRISHCRNSIIGTGPTHTLFYARQRAHPFQSRIQPNSPVNIRNFPDPTRFAS